MLGRSQQGLSLRHYWRCRGQNGPVTLCHAFRLLVGAYFDGMQPAPKQPAGQPPVKIYNAVYSSVQVYWLQFRLFWSYIAQVYECMIRGIAVMRRRGDSYVNATQILKVAGVDKGRRTKILEKEILPGKHEIVQGGYGKYQGTWLVPFFRIFLDILIILQDPS